MNYDDYEILVNKEHLLPKDYCPNDLIVTDNNENNFHQFKDPKLKPMVRKIIYPYLEKMMQDAKINNIEFIVDSGYRSYDYQKVLLEALIHEKGTEAYSLVALPGASEHQTGLAIDIAYYKDGIYFDDVKESDPAAIWLAQNSYKYGFILRYPKGKECATGFQYEPWHFRFVGLNLAQKLFNEGVTLDEYYARKDNTILKR